MRYRDAHTHLSAGACDLADVDARPMRATGELAKAIARAVLQRPAGTWVRAWGWAGDPPAADPCPEHPLWLTRPDGHGAWLNDAAREALDVRDGLVAEESFDALRRKLPAPSDGERRAAIEARIGELGRMGVVAVDDVVEAWGPDLWGSFAPGIDVGLWVPVDTPAPDLERWRCAFPPERRGVALRGVKVFLDGTLRARTAALSAPYADAPETRGALRLPADALTAAVSRLAARGYPVAIHAIGDRAVTAALDALEGAGRPAWGAHRIEHAQVVARGDLPRFARAGIVASLQPGHFADDRPWLPARVGERDGVIVHPLGSLLDAGAEVVLGSDWPVSTWDPEAIVAAASDPQRGREAIPAERARGLLSA